MNYKRIYNSIVFNRLANPLPKKHYTEKHHIVPRSLGGGDEKSNLVRLTAREHFICHMLLAEMFPRNSREWYKMNRAFMAMNRVSGKQNRYINSRYYELKRIDFSTVIREAHRGDKNPNKDNCWIFNDEKKQSIVVAKDKISSYLSKGWKRGRVINWESREKELQRKTKAKRKVWLNGRKNLAEKEANRLFDLFLLSGCKSITQFSKTPLAEGKSQGNLSATFKKYLPERYSELELVQQQNKKIGPVA